MLTITSIHVSLLDHSIHANFIFNLWIASVRCCPTASIMIRPNRCPLKQTTVLWFLEEMISRGCQAVCRSSNSFTRHPCWRRLRPCGRRGGCCHHSCANLGAGSGGDRISWQFHLITISTIHMTSTLNGIVAEFSFHCRRTPPSQRPETRRINCSAKQSTGWWILNEVISRF